MGNTFSTSKNNLETILIEKVDKETGVTTRVNVDINAYDVLTEHFKERAKAECWHESSGLNKPDVNQQRELLNAFRIWHNESEYEYERISDAGIDEFLKAFNCG